MVVQATSTADDAARGAEPSGAQRYVEALAVLPGAEHVAVVDIAGERVLGEWGGPPGSARALLERAREAADPSRRGRRELEDLVSTIGPAFHLSRLVLAGPGHPESVWVAVRIDRARGNLTWAKGILAGLGGPAGASFARSATPAGDVRRAHAEATADVPRAPHGEGAASASHAPAVVPPPPAPPDHRRRRQLLRSRPRRHRRSPRHRRSRPAPEVPPAPEARSAPEVPVVPKAQVTLKATAGPKGPVAASAVAEAAATVELVVPRPTVPAARTSPENRPEPSLPDQSVPGQSMSGQDRKSSFAPVMVVPAPPSPVPDDGTCEEPAPMPAPIITAPPLLPDGRVDDGGPPAGSGPDGSGEAGTPDQARPEYSQRNPGVQLVPRIPGPSAVRPPRPATSGTDATAFTDEPSVLRRLIHGLRRPS